MNFDSFRLHPKLAAGVRDMGYVTPTPIQERAIPHGLAGRDVLGLAQTGTGKTAAFALPILQRLMDGPRGRLRALVVAPTRELAEQIHEAFRGLGRHTGLRSMTVYGGVGMGPQLAGLRAGVEVVVACPGRLLDHCGQGTARLSHVETLVLDEADRMFDMGFLPDIRRITRLLPPRRQNLLFSATMPEDIRRLADEVLRDPVTVSVAHGEPLATVTHALFPTPEHVKAALLPELLRRTDRDSVLVFTRTKRRAKRLAAALSGAGFSSADLQGNLSQNRRKAALEGFRDGSVRVLVATDIAARGIDVSQISHVVNYDMPDTVEAYTHRIGRTGRAARTGDAFTFVTPEDADMVRRIEAALGQRLERRTLEGFDYAARPAGGAPRHGGHGHRDGGRPARHAPHGGPNAPQAHAPRPEPRREPPPPRGLMSSRSRRPARRGR